MNARLVAIATLVALAPASSPALAVTECLPRQIVGAIQHTQRVRVVQLGPVEERRGGLHEDPPGRFLGCRRIGRASCRERVSIDV